MDQSRPLRDHLLQLPYQKLEILLFWVRKLVDLKMITTPCKVSRPIRHI
jgi:hypothetical protein